MTLGKTVVGGYASDDALYTFTITANPPADWAGETLANASFVVTGVEGVTELVFNEASQATLRMKKDQQAVIQNLPAGWTYAIEEAKVKDYTPSHRVGTDGVETKGATAEVTLTESTSVAFINKYLPEPPSTGVSPSGSAWLPLLLLSAAGVLMLLGRRHRMQ